MSSTSNNVYSGYQAWAVRSGYTPSFNTKGPWFNYSAYADSQGALYGIQSKSSGKIYFEFNFRRANTTEVEYYFGLSTSSHSPTDLPGLSTESWSFCTEAGSFYHDSTETTTADSYIYGLLSETRGYYYDYYSYYYADDYVVKVAIDFDNGYIWFGTWNGSLDTWDGDPAAGTDPTYTFTPNTSLFPALGWKFLHTGFLCTAMVELGCSRDYARRLPPSGFSYWDEYDHQTEVIADSPVGYWMASPHKYGETFISNSLGFPGLFGDSSVNQKYTEHYNGNSYNFLTADANGIFASAPAYRWYAGANSSFGKYPAAIASTASFTLEASVEITGAGATNGGSDIWTEGSGLVCNYVQANQQASFTLASLWTGISYRDRRFKFGLDTYEVTAGSDVGDGAHHVMAVWDHSASTMTLYVDGAQVGQTTSVSPATKSSSWLAWGALRPNQTNGNFPGYFRDCAFYPSALSSTRVAAHYDVLSSTDVDLAGSASASSTATGNLTFPVDLAASVEALATAAGNLYMALALAGASASQSTATGDLTVPPMAIDLEGEAVAESTATGDLSPHPLAGSAQAVSTAAGALATLINLAANAESEAGATGDPDVLVAIAGAASALAAASATLGQAALLHGDAAGIATAAASMAMELGLSGDAADRVTAAGQLSSVSNLASAAQAVATVAGALDQSTAVAGAAQAVATAAGDLSNVIAMQGAAAAQASATGALSKAETITGGLVYAVNLTTGAVTTLSNFYFERLVRAHGRTYGLLAGTLYRIEGTADPGDTPISVSIRTGSIPPKADVLRRLDKVYLHARERAGITMTPIYDEVQGRTHYPRPGIRDGMIVHRTNIGINNRWHTLGLQITNIDGGTLDIGGLEILTEPLTRRIT